MNVIENVPFFFSIVYVDAKGKFLRIWAHTDDKLYQSVQSILLELAIQNKFDFMTPLTPRTARPGTRCLVRNISNNQLSRVEILSCRPDGMSLVRFVDYGNVTYVPLNNIRLSDGSPEAQFVFNVPETAYPFIIADVTPVGGIWTDEIVGQIRYLLCKNKFQGVYFNFNNDRAIRFRNSLGEDFGQTLIKKNVAEFSPFLQPTLHPTLPPQLLSRVSMASKENFNSDTSQKTLRNNSFKAMKLEVGSEHEVRVSYIEDGPLKFSVQLVSYFPHIKSMMEKINSQQHIHLQEPPIAGVAGLAKRAVDGRMYRVVLNSPGDTSCKVYYVDYGQHEDLSFDNIYELPDEFITPNVYSIRFTLNGSTDWKIDQDIRDYFEGWVSNKNLKLRVCKGPMSPLVQYCDLFVDGESVKDRLIQEFPELSVLAYPEPIPFEKGQTEKVSMSYIESTLKFFVQRDKEFPLLEALMERIDELAKDATHISPSQLCSNLACLALYSGDHKWYRASVLARVDNQKVRVSFVDYGNEDVVPLSHLKAIHPLLVKMLPKQAIKCSLNVFLSGPLVDADIIKEFGKIANEKSLSLSFIENSNDSNIVDLMELDNSVEEGISITNKLISYMGMNRQNSRSLDQYSKPLHKRNNNNWNTQGLDTNQSQSYNRNNSENLYNSNPKFHKGIENARGQENRFHKNYSNNTFEPRNSEYSANSGNKEYQNNQFFDDSSNKINQSTNRGSNVNNGFASKGDKRNSYDQITNDFPQKQISNNNQIGNWQSEHITKRQDDINKISIGDHSALEKAKSTEDLDACHSSMSSSYGQDLCRYSTSTPTPICNKIPLPNITTGAIKSCMVCYYVNPNDFYVHLSPDYEELDHMMLKISDVYSSGGKISQPACIVEDFQCVAQYSEDQGWYRAVVKSIDNLSATVHFIDYGNSEKVSFDQIKDIEPEFVKLPTQAIHCKMFCPSKSSWSKEDCDKLFLTIEDKTLETEFIHEENSQYHVFIKILESKMFVNALFTPEADLIKEKESLCNKSLATTQEAHSLPNYASLNEKYEEVQLPIGEKCLLNFSYFESPDDFILQPSSQQEEFDRVYNEMAATEMQPITEPLKAGQSVIATNPADEVLYRAKIIGPSLEKYEVEFIDYGDLGIIDSSKIYKIEKKFMSLPKQAIKCSLKGVAPVTGSSWKDSSKLKDFFVGDELDCTIHQLINGKYVISMKNKGKDVAETLVRENLAVSIPITTEKIDHESGEKVSMTEIPKMDFKLLEGQTLKVKVSCIESTSRFFVQFNSAAVCQKEVDLLMSSKNTEVMPKLSKHELIVGSGCLVKTRGKWKRGVIINESEMYTVSLIDTGDQQKFKSDSLLRLPNELAVVQNQAVECNLFDVPMSTKANDTFKELCLEKYVLIFIEKVETNRLSVRLFDTNGAKIKIVDTQNMETISYITSLPVLSSQHKIIVTWINDANSLWLQFAENSVMESKLLDSMYEHYSQMSLEMVDDVDLREDNLYAALCSDNNWYRVKLNQLIGNSATVTFLDYGNVETIPSNNLRYLDPRFYEPHQLGIEVSLKISMPGNAAAQVKHLEPLLLGKTGFVTLYNVNRKWFADLVDVENTEDISERLTALSFDNNNQDEIKSDVGRIREGAETLQPISPVEEWREGGTYAVRLGHIVSPHALWLQRSEHSHYINELQDRLFREAESYPEVDTLTDQNSLYICRSLDKQWYRAQILDLDLLTIRYIDLGSEDMMELHNGTIRQMPPDMQALPNFAICCKLDLKVPPESEWSDEANNKLKELVSGQDKLQAVVISAKGPFIIDLLLADGSSVCHKMIELGLAQRVQSPEQHDEVITISDDETEMDPRAAYVSATESVEEFWVQEDKWTSELRKMEDRLLMSGMLDKEKELKSGLLCIALFPDDGKYYRARVIEPIPDGKCALVNYIDFGNSQLSYDLRKIPQDLVEIKPLARKCKLAKPAGLDSWPSGINEEFAKLSDAGATVFLLDIIKEAKQICTVKLSLLSGKDVAIELIERLKQSQVEIEPQFSSMAISNAVVESQPTTPAQSDTVIEPRPTPIGQEHTGECGICYITSPSDFWIHEKNNFAQIEEISQRLCEAESYDPINEISVGKLVAAKFDEDGLWYRSRILSHHTSEGIELHYVDYGNNGHANDCSTLRELPQDLSNLPDLAAHCSLEMPDTVIEWPKCACAKFVELAEAGCAVFDFKFLKTADKNAAGKLVSLFKEGKSVVEILMMEFASLNDTGDSAFISGGELATSHPSSFVRVSGNSHAAVQIPDNIPQPSLEIEATLAKSKENKIVPGSICRGRSVENIDRYEYDNFPTLDENTSIKSPNADQLLVCEVDKQQVIKPIPIKTIESFVPTPISHDDRLASSYISNRQPYVCIEPMEAPKILHADEAISGAIGEHQQA